jgi:hypothetical protein
MPHTPDRDENIRDLEPQQPEQQTVKPDDADAVKGGRKAGGGQQDYLTVTLDAPIIT